MHGRPTHHRRIIRVFSVVIIIIFVFTMMVSFVMYLGGGLLDQDRTNETQDTQNTQDTQDTENTSEESTVDSVDE